MPLAVPYGVYDLTADAGWVTVGVDHDTSAFAVASIRRWCLGAKKVDGRAALQSVRHGIAHSFVVKGGARVAEGMPELHLARDEMGRAHVDANQLADDFIVAYRREILGRLTALEEPNSASMERRLQQMEAEYHEQVKGIDLSFLPWVFWFGLAGRGASGSFGPDH